MLSCCRLPHISSGLVIAISICCLGAQDDRSKQRAVTPKDAQRLAYEVFKAWGSTKLPKFGLEVSPKSMYKGFYTIEATWENPSPGSGIVGHVVVDQRTGDVWDPFTCEPYSYPALERLQRQIRKRLGLTENEYLRLKKSPPC